MIPLDIDLSEVVAEFSLTAQQTEQLGSAIIDRVVTEYMSKWEDLVDRGLRQTRGLYKRAMYVDRVSPTEVIFGLAPGDDGLALAIEEGKAGWDEKPFFKASSKSRRKLGGGWYLTVPFRHATPDAVAEAGVFQSVLSREVHDIARANSGRPVKTQQLPEQYQRLGVRQETMLGSGLMAPSYTHRTPKYQGLVRIDIRSTDREKRGGYYTFRRVSDTSDPNSWIHPAMDARRFMDSALDAAQIDTVTAMVIDEVLSQI